MHGTRIALSIAAALAAWSPAAVSAETQLHGASRASGSGAVELVRITAGKPSELHFTVSKPAKLSAGTVRFTVKNAGKAVHDFKVCTAPVMGAAANTCAGKTTGMLKPGQTATLTIALAKGGTYEYLCSVPGHAAAGMKGLVTIAAPIAAAAAAAPAMTTAQAPAASPATNTAAPATDAQTPTADQLMGMGGG
jgi:uncharacterized cupredoxin-like copper-binding protein